MLPLLKPNYHQKKWPKYKLKPRLKQMHKHQLHRLLFKLQLEMLLNYQQLKKHKLKLKHKLKPKLKELETSAMLKHNYSLRIKQLQLKMKLLPLQPPSHIQELKFNFPKTKH